MTAAVFVDLRERATETEGLDVGVPEDEARASLADIRLVNRWLGGHRSFLRTVLPLVESLPRPTLLDVGCGSADLPARLGRRARVPLLAVGLDRQLVHVREAPPQVTRVVADVRGLPFGDASFDVVTASLFLHHFDGPEVPRLLAALYRLCRRALVINDLHRARTPYVFGRLVFPLLFRSSVSVADGLLSIRRAFTPAELTAAFAEARIPRVRLRRFFPYRLVAVAMKG